MTGLVLPGVVARMVAPNLEGNQLSRQWDHQSGSGSVPK